MFTFERNHVDELQIDQFEVTGSTYEPKGDILFNGAKFKCSNRSGLVELAECAALCNDSSLDYNDVRYLPLFHIHIYYFVLFENR